MNWDQTALKIVPVNSLTMEKNGSKRVELIAIDDKRQITGVFACSLTGTFLPLQPDMGQALIKVLQAQAQALT